MLTADDKTDRESMRAQAQAREAQRLDAIHSSKWSPAQFAPHALRWLQQNDKTSRLFTLPTAESSSKAPETLEPAAMPRARPGSFSANPVVSIVKPHLGPLLHALVLDSSLAFAIITALDNWKQWSDKGGMRREDLDALMQSGGHGGGEDDDETRTETVSPAAALAMASLVAAVIGSIGDGNSAGGMGPPVEALLSHDLRECLKMWPKVRLG